MNLAPWLVSAALAVIVLVLTGKLLSRSRREEAASTAVRVDGTGTIRPPRPDAPAREPAPSPAPSAPPVRVTSYRAPAMTLTSAVGARQAAKAAIARRDIRAAVVLYRDAGLVDEAVSLLVGVLGAPAEAASMLAKRGDHARAADLYELAGKSAKAAREWALVAESAPDSAPYLRRVRRLDPGLADALADSHLDSFDVYDAPTRQIQAVLAGMPPLSDEDGEQAEESESEGAAADMPADEIERLASAAAEAASRRFDSVMPPADDDAGPAAHSRVRTPPPSSVRAIPACSWSHGIEEDAPEGLSPDMTDVELLRAGVAIPLLELEAMTRDQACDLSNIEVFYRIGMARLAIGNWVAALAAFDAVEETSPGYRDAELRGEQVRAWQLCLGNRRSLDEGRLEVLGRFEEGADAIVYRVRERAHARDALLHVPRSGPVPDFRLRAEELALLDHPNLTRVLSGVPLDGGGVLSTETADGPTLSARIALGPRPTVVDALRITAQLCEAIEATTGGRGKEIDPADVRIVAGGMVKVMRWGWWDDSNPSAFRAPEAKGDAGDGRSLVYAVGAVLVYALSGDYDLARAAHLDATWLAVDKAAPYLPLAVKEVARRATALEPGDRFPSLKGLRLAVRNLLKQVQRRASSMTLPAVGSATR